MPAGSSMSWNALHGAIEREFSGERDDHLWRLDVQPYGPSSLLLLSEKIPETGTVVRQFSPGGQWESKPYSSYISSIKNGERLAFTLTACPTKSVAQPHTNGKKPRGKVCAITDRTGWAAWLEERSTRLGFALDGELLIRPCDKITVEKKKENRRFFLCPVRYDGALTVTDKDRFRDTLITGIGRGRAYGMGMMTVARI